MEHENIIDKIKKLSAHADSAKKLGSFAEAELFAEKVNALLIKHKLDMDDISDDSTEDDKVDMELFQFSKHGMDDTKKRCSWQEILAHYVAKYHFCRIMVVPGHNSLFFIGKKEDRACLLYLYGFLVKTLRQECQRQYDKEYSKHYIRGTTWMMQDWRNSFFMGAIQALSARFEKIRSAEKASEHSNQFALVLQRSEKELDDFIEDKSAKKVKSNAKTCKNGNAYKLGETTANNIQLNKAVESTTNRNLLNV